MSAALLDVMQRQVESYSRQLEMIAKANEDIRVENERLRNLLTEMVARHEADQQTIERLRASARD